MKTTILSFLLMFSTAFLSAQTTPATTPGPAQSATPPGSMRRPLRRDMGAIQRRHTQEMKAQVEKMRATLQQMKENLAKVENPALQRQSQFDVDLWEAMVTHMEDMVGRMSEGNGMGMGMMPGGGMRDGMGCCAGMKNGGCCGGMKPGTGCCGGGNKCMQGTANTPAAPDKPVSQ